MPTNSRTSFGQRTLSREYFASQQLFDAERERIFSRSWLLAGHVSQLAQPGSFFLFERDAESVIVLRGADNQIRAFHNLCRHRGSRLCKTSSGNMGAAIVCPYHAWSYALDGSLRTVPAMSEVANFDHADYPLLAVALTNCDGFLFVNFDADPDGFARALPGLIERFTRHETTQLQSVHTETYTVAANWKLLFHNFSECYHCPTVHPLLNTLTPFRNSENDLIEGAVLGGPMWMSNVEGSMTMHGERCASAFAGLSAAERARVYYYTLFPSAFISFHPEYVLVHRITPLAKDSSRIVCDWYFHAQAIAYPTFDAQPAIAFWDLTNRQDWELCANVQAGVASLAWTPGPYAELESQVAAFDRHYLGAMQAASASAWSATHVAALP